jgi:mRNA interferase MazF
MPIIIPEKSALFDIWNQEKQKLDTNYRTLLFKEGEIWWCSLGMNIGEEIYGKGSEFSRPVIILKKLSNNSCVVLPVTSQARSGTWYFTFNSNKQDRCAILNQIKFISANRLIKRESQMTISVFRELKKSVARLLGLS